MNFQEPDDGFKPKYKPGPGMPQGMSPLPKDLPVELNKPGALPRGRGVRSKNPFPPKPIPGDFSGKVPRTIPSPTTAPRPISSGPVINFPALARSIAWEILKPTPTADGTLPDFQHDFPDPEPVPESSEKESICMTICIPNALWYMPNGRGDYVVSIYADELITSDGFPMADGYGIPDVPRSLGFYKELTSRVRPEGTNFEYGAKSREWVHGKESKVEDGIAQIRYIFGIQYYGELRLSRIKWTGQIGIWQSAWYLKSSGISPEGAKNDMFGTFRWRKRPSRYGEIVYCRVPFCNDFDDSPPENDTDYDREDDGMACKWKPENDADVNQLEMQSFEYDKFTECYIDGDARPVARYQLTQISLPKGFADSFLEILRQHNQAMGTRCSQFNPNYYWDLKPGLQNTVFVGLPGIVGQEIELPEGCSEVGITFDAGQAKSDTNLRDLKRISALATNENSFVNVAQVWVIDDMGNAIANEQLWVPSTLILIPLQYRQRICKLRLLTKSIAVEYTVFDSGARWQLRRGEIG